MSTASLIALAITAAAILYIVWGLRVRTGVTLSKALIILVAAVFAGLVIIYYPISYSKYSEVYGNSGAFTIAVVSLLQCMQNALRTFVLDGSWSELLPSEGGGLQIPMHATAIGLFLNVFAPLLTFSAILSLFKEIIARVRVRAMASRKRPMFLFSELNSNTIFLARDIRARFPKANLVYTDVYPEDDEANYELREQAARLNAVMLRTDISELDLKRRKGLTEYYLLGHDEDENVMQARRLFMKNRDSSDTGIYVMASRKGNALILDSLAASLDTDSILRKAESKGWDYEALREDIRGGGILRFRRVDIDLQTAWRDIPKIECIRKAFAGPCCNREKTLSILVFADTRLGYEAIRTLLWLCQSDRFRLELNVIYADDVEADAMVSCRTGEKVNARRLLELECPDIIRTNGLDVAGESFYDIEFFESSGFGSKDLTGRLARTDAVIVDRVADDETLETAASLRTAFERAGLRPEIYAVCADEDDVMKDINTYNNLVTYKDENYDIRFLGLRRDMYKYDSIRNTDEEHLGFFQHVKWIDVSNSRTLSGTRDNDLKRALLDYERHEYFRQSSMSRAMYLRNALCDPDKELSAGQADEVIRAKGWQGIIDENTRFEQRLSLRPEYECLNDPQKPSDRWLCSCEHCLRRRESEHNRWNAYMRVQGYIPSPEGNISEKSAMALIHGNLVPFGELDEAAREKDG